MRLLKIASVFFLTASILDCSGSDNSDRSARRGTTLPREATLIEPASFESLRQEDGSPDPQTFGTWRSRGYGFVLQLNDSAAELYLETTAGCYSGGYTEEDLTDLFGFYGYGGTQDVLFLTSSPGSTLYLFDRLDMLPAHCSKVQAWSPPELVEIFAATFEVHYPFFHLRRIDWGARHNAARARIRDDSSDQELFDILVEMISGLKDPHTEIIEAEIGGETLDYSDGHGATLERLYSSRPPVEYESDRAYDLAWIGEFRRAVAEDVLLGKGSRDARGRIDWGAIDDDIGYLQLLTFDGYSEDGGPDAEIAVADQALTKALAVLADKQALIVDVSQNRGGTDLAALAVAGHFAESSWLVFRKRPFRRLGQEELAWQDYLIEPRGAQPFTKPVYLLTSDVTVSAGEIFTLAMRTLPHVRHIGETTRGAFSDELPRSLPNGWWFGLSNELYIDAEGISHEGRGLEPSTPLEVFAGQADLFQAHPRAISRLVQKIRDDLGL